MTSGVPYAEVIGDPISHSKSPLIHRFWLRKTGVKGDYRATRVGKGELAAHLHRRLGEALWRGCNVTMPLKREALALAGDNPTGRAVQAGAANLLLPKGTCVSADNSDVVAIARLLHPNFRAAPHVVVHLVGTGGAAAAAVAAVKQVGPPISIFSYARSEESALAFRQQVGLEASPMHCFPLAGCRPWGSSADVVINATPLGMTGRDPLHFPLADFEAGAMVFDMVYDPLETPLLAEARGRALRVIDGLQMLVEQAALSFELFFGVEAPRQHDDELRRLLTA